MSSSTLELGPARITLHRTIRVAEGKQSALPPSLGHCTLYKVSDYKDKCPEDWDENGYFVALHEKEALWLSFSTSGYPVAMLVGAGGVNALNGKPLGLKLEDENYLVHPPQPWLDGWKNEDGSVYQFVGTEYKKGEGLSVGEQLHKEKCKTGGIGIAVFEAEKPEETFKDYYAPRRMGFGGGSDMELCVSASDAASLDFDGGEYESPCSFSPCAATPKGMVGLASASPLRGAVRARAAEMGVGKGGKITQSVYPDPYGKSVWKGEPSAATAVYLVNAVDFTAITGLPMPPIPAGYEQYYGPWYGVQDEHLGDTKGSDKFAGLKTVFANDPAEVVSEGPSIG